MSKHPTHIWMVVGSSNPCDIRRYAYSHREAVGQLRHRVKLGFKDYISRGIWTLFKLVQVNKRRTRPQFRPRRRKR